MNIHVMIDKKEKKKLAASYDKVLQVLFPSSRSWEDLSDGVPGALTEPFWELDLILDYQVTSTIGPFGIR